MKKYCLSAPCKESSVQRGGKGADGQIGVETQWWQSNHISGGRLDNVTPIMSCRANSRNFWRENQIGVEKRWGQSKSISGESLVTHSLERVIILQLSCVRHLAQFC